MEVALKEFAQLLLFARLLSLLTFVHSATTHLESQLWGLFQFSGPR